MEQKKQARIQDQSEEVRNPLKVDHLDPKSGLFEHHPPQPSYKFLAHSVAKSGPFDIFGMVRCTPPGYGPGKKYIMGSPDIFLAYCSTPRNAL